MTSYRTALRNVLARQFAPGLEDCALVQAAGRILATEFRAPEALPRTTYSAMDGYAVRLRDLADASLRSLAVLQIAGESRPGRPYEGPALGRREAVAIATGAAIPRGADSIVPVEWVANSDRKRVWISRAPRRREFFRRAGSDVKKGSRLLPRGTRMDGSAIAVFAQFGIDRVRVVREPRVGLLTSGDEVVALGKPRGRDRIVASNLYYACQVLRDFGCEARVFGIAPDRASAVRKLLTKAVNWGDLVVTSAGVSAGKRDLVRPVLESLGAEVIFHRVAIKPGHPTLFARVGKTPVFGLPGNPLSCACGIEIFVKPYLRKCMGIKPLLPERMQAPLAGPAARDPRRLSFLFSRVEWTSRGPLVHPPGKQESGNLSMLARANGLAEIPPGEGFLAAGEPVWVWPLR